MPIEGIKEILAVKIKPRHDTYADQFSRIFMVKVMMVGALLVGLNWYSDKIACIIPKTAGIDDGFVSQACWINGLYVYEEIRYHENQLGYYGIPNDISFDGMYPDGALCSTSSENCKPMEKTFFLQYQYMTFVLAALAVLYYAPYCVFRYFNEDMVSLKGSVKDNDATGIVKNYFNYNINKQAKMRVRVLGNIMVKLLYIATSFCAFLVTDSILSGHYRMYGVQWNTWAKLPNPLAYDYMGDRLSPKPGNVLLPSFAFCEVQESSQDIKHVITNKHKFVCEVSQHILYQYVFIITWFCMIFAIIIAVLSLLLLLVGYVITLATCCIRRSNYKSTMYSSLTLRELEYLEYIRRKNLPLYGTVCQSLKEERYDNIVNHQHNSSAPMLKGGEDIYEMRS